MSAIRVGLISTLQQIVNMIKNLSDRYIIRELLSFGKELPIWKLLSIEYLKQLTLKQVLGLGIIASFTLVTFPIGVWLDSFSKQVSMPIDNIITVAIQMLLFPVNLFLINKTLSEFPITNKIIMGIMLIEIAYFIIIVGWVVIYYGIGESKI